jgi:hypothetical protein
MKVMGRVRTRRVNVSIQTRVSLSKMARCARLQSHDPGPLKAEAASDWSTLVFREPQVQSSQLGLEGAMYEQEIQRYIYISLAHRLSFLPHFLIDTCPKDPVGCARWLHKQKFFERVTRTTFHRSTLNSASSANADIPD